MKHVQFPGRRSALAPILQPLQAFLAAESASGLVLMLSALAAILWANSPWGASYQNIWHLELGFSVGSHDHAMSLAHWVNDGLMAIFFLLVGLEIKRELVMGELASIQRAALPMVAALGGMIIPALIFAAFNSRGAGAAGWGIPMATDIAFAVGALSLVGKSVPTSVKVFLLAIAIFDDLGAVIVIATFYTAHLEWIALSVAGLILLLLGMLNLLKVHRPLPYVLLGICLWIAMLWSGVHATIAGVLLAFTIPATRRIEELPYVRSMRNMLAQFEEGAAADPVKFTPEQSYVIKAMEEVSQAVQVPLARVEHALLVPVNFLIVPLFALANAGVNLRGSGSVALSPVMWGVMIGLFVGKPTGVLLASWGAIKTGIAVLPQGATGRQLIGIAGLCGIGFTVSIFVGNLAFPRSENLLAAAKIGILSGSLLSGIAGGMILRTPNLDRSKTA